MSKEEEQKIAVKFFTQIYAGSEKPSLLASIIYAEAKEDWGAIYLMLEEVKQFVDKLQKGMKGE